MRPSTYSKEVLEDAQNYLENYNSEFNQLVPTVEGLCGAINRSKSTVYSWKKDEDKREFLHTLEAIQEVQAVKLINGSLGGDMNPTISKLMLANHGYHEKVETDHKSSDGSMSPKSGLDDFYCDS